MQAYLNHFQQPPPNRLVTHKLESENKYDDSAWNDHHWEDSMEKQVEIGNTANHSSPIVSNVSDDTFDNKTPTTKIKGGVIRRYSPYGQFAPHTDCPYS